MRNQASALRSTRGTLNSTCSCAVSTNSTVVEKRATFACTPGLQRPSAQIAPGLLACGDYVAGPYPATLEGAVRSGLHAARLLKAAETTGAVVGHLLAELGSQIPGLARFPDREIRGRGVGGGWRCQRPSQAACQGWIHLPR